MEHLMWLRPWSWLCGGITAAMVVHAGCSECGEGIVTLDPAVKYPVSVQYHNAQQSLIVASYDGGAVYRVGTKKGTPTKTLLAPNLDGRRNALRIRLDAERDRLWVLDYDALYLYRLETAQFVRRIALATLYTTRGQCISDMTIDGSGDVLISSALQPMLYRVDGKGFFLTEHKISVHEDNDKDFGFSALAFDDTYKTLYAASAAIGSLWTINLAQGKASKLKLTKPVRGACALAAGIRTIAIAQGSKLTLYIASGFEDGLSRVDLHRPSVRYLVEKAHLSEYAETPTDVVKMGRIMLIPASQLGSHPDFGGDGNVRMPFQIFPALQPSFQR